MKEYYVIPVVLQPNEPDYDLILAFSRGIQKSYNMRHLELKEVFIAVTSQVLTLMHATTINNIWERVSAMETLPDDAFKAVRQKISEPKRKMEKGAEKENW